MERPKGIAVPLGRRDRSKIIELIDRRQGEAGTLVRGSYVGFPTVNARMLM